MNSKHNRKEHLMKAIVLLLTAAIFTSPLAHAEPKVLYTCTPIKPTDLLLSLTVTEITGIDYHITLAKKDAANAETTLEGAAAYYDDMTYFGYYSESLDVAIQLGYPYNQEEAQILYLGDSRIWMNCTEHSTLPKIHIKNVYNLTINSIYK